MARVRTPASPVKNTFAAHTGHAQHMCELVRKRQMAQAAELSLNARYICHICGRAAAEAENLCEPVKIPKA